MLYTLVRVHAKEKSEGQEGNGKQNSRHEVCPCAQLAVFRLPLPHASIDEQVEKAKERVAANEMMALICKSGECSHEEIRADEAVVRVPSINGQRHRKHRGVDTETGKESEAVFEENLFHQLKHLSQGNSSPGTLGTGGLG